MADEFFEIAAKRVDEDFFAAVATYRVYPVVVNYSFSCELYIKALMMYRNGNGTFVKGHHLKELIEKHLNAQDYAAIKNRCKAVFRTPFDNALQEFNTSFEDWRYGFEKNAVIDIDDLIQFAKVLRAYAHEVTGI